jgi:hypothetical protein
VADQRRAQLGRISCDVDFDEVGVGDQSFSGVVWNKVVEGYGISSELKAFAGAEDVFIRHDSILYLNDDVVRRQEGKLICEQGLTGGVDEGEAAVA